MRIRCPGTGADLRRYVADASDAGRGRRYSDYFRAIRHSLISQVSYIVFCADCGTDDHVGQPF